MTKYIRISVDEQREQDREIAIKLTNGLKELGIENIKIQFKESDGESSEWHMRHFIIFVTDNSKQE